MLFLAKKFKIGLTAGFCALGVILLILAIVMKLKHKKASETKWEVAESENENDD